ncbi:hypothetical protein [Zavarzinella formosa]|uniref:hypothetical protein n=1 Tax=Zavarzinella formosa TaxID=360055 RepID=UPI0002D44C09|nr:hypothetical protein [Zavarzinella formosa]
MLTSVILAVASLVPVSVTVEDLVNNRDKYQGRMVRLELTPRYVYYGDGWGGHVDAPTPSGFGISGLFSPAIPNVRSGDRIQVTGIFTHNIKVWPAHRINVVAVEQKPKPERKPTPAQVKAQKDAESALTGEWTGRAFQEPRHFGQPLRETTLTIEKGVLTLTQKGKLVMAGPVTIDAEYRLLDVAVTEGPWKGKTVEGEFILARERLLWTAAFPGEKRIERWLGRGPEKD